MDCPRCGTELTSISIDGGSTAVYCDHCGFADIETSPVSAEPESETWDDALDRFHDAASDTNPEDTNGSIDADDDPDVNTDTESRSDVGSDTSPEDTDDDDEDEDEDADDHDDDDADDDESDTTQCADSESDS